LNRVFESLQMVLLVHAFYIAGITNFGDFISDRKGPWSLRLQEIFGVLITCAIQQFYAWRIHQFSKHSMGQPYIPGFIVAMSFVELGLGIAFFIHSLRRPYFNQVTEGANIRVTIALLCVQVSCDLAIMVSMVYYLYKRCTPVRRTMAMISTLALYFIITGALALVFAILCLVAFVRFSHTTLFLPPFFAVVRIYVCAFLTILNSRDGLRTKFAADAQNGIMISMPTLRFTPDFKPGGNTGDTTTDAVADKMDLGSTDPTSQDFPQVEGDSTLPSEV